MGSLDMRSPLIPPAREPPPPPSRQIDKTTTNHRGVVALGGAWKAQEEARSQAAEAAREQERRAEGLANEREALARDNEDLRSQLVAMNGRLRAACGREAALERRLNMEVGRRWAAEAAGLGGRRCLDNALRAEAAASEKASALSAENASLHQKEAGLSARLEADTRDNCELRDLFYSEQAHTERLKAEVQDADARIAILTHSRDQKDKQIATLSKEKNRAQDAMKRMRPSVPRRTAPAASGGPSFHTPGKAAKPGTQTFIAATPTQVRDSIPEFLERTRVPASPNRHSPTPAASRGCIPWAVPLALH